VRGADNITTFTCRLSLSLGLSISGNSQSLSRPVQRLLYLYLHSCFSFPVCKSHLPCAALNCHLWPVGLHHIHPHHLINGKIFGKRLCFHSLRLLSETFLVLRRILSIPFSDQKMYTGLHVRYPSFLSDFNENSIFSMGS
jgi:hypothetical protein